MVFFYGHSPRVVFRNHGACLPAGRPDLMLLWVHGSHKGPTLDQGSERWQYSETQCLLLANGNELRWPKTLGGQSRLGCLGALYNRNAVEIKTPIVCLEARLSDNCRCISWDLNLRMMRIPKWSCSSVLGVVT